MSKKVKSLIEREFGNRLKGVDGVAVISPRGIDGIKTNNLRRKLREKNCRMMVVKNTLVRRATSGTKLNGFDKLLDGPSAVVYGEQSIAAIARLLLDEKKTNDTLELRGVFFDGELFSGLEGVEQASKLPTREEAIANLVAAILSPGRKLGGIFKGQASIIASILKTIEDKAKERGDTMDAPQPAIAAPAAAAPEVAESTTTEAPAPDAAQPPAAAPVEPQAGDAPAEGETPSA